MENNTDVISVVYWEDVARADPVTLTSPGRLSDPQGHETTPEADAIMLDPFPPPVSGSP